MWKCHILSFRPSISYIWRFIYVHTLYTLLLPFNDNLVNITFCHHFANKRPNSQSYGFPSSHVWMWKLDHKDGWAPKNWCFQIVVLEKTLESLLDSKEIKPVNPKGNKPWIFTGRMDAEAPILWPLDAKSWLIGKDPDAGKDWRQKEGRGWGG